MLPSFGGFIQLLDSMAHWRLDFKFYLGRPTLVLPSSGEILDSMNELVLPSGGGIGVK